jgi:hypothetical protein
MVVRPGHALTKGRITKQGLFEFPHVVVEIVWHDRLAFDRGFDWIREVLASSAEEFVAGDDSALTGIQ